MAIFGTSGTTKGIWGRPRLMLSTHGGGGNRSTPSLALNGSGRIPYLDLIKRSLAEKSHLYFSSWAAKYGHQRNITIAVIKILNIFDSHEIKPAAVNACNYIIDGIKDWEKRFAILEGVWIFNPQAHNALKDKVFNIWLKEQVVSNKEYIEMEIAKILRRFRDFDPGISAFETAIALREDTERIILEGLRISDPSVYNSMIIYLGRAPQVKLIFDPMFQAWLEKIDSSYRGAINTILEALIELDTKKAIEKIYNILQNFNPDKQNTLKKGLERLDPKSHTALTTLESFKNWQQNQNPSDLNFLKGKVNAIIKAFENTKVRVATATAFESLKKMGKEKRDSILEGVKIWNRGAYRALNELFEHIASLLNWYKEKIENKNVDEFIVKETRKKRDLFWFTFMGNDHLMRLIFEELEIKNPALAEILRTGEAPFFEIEEPQETKPQKLMREAGPNEKEIRQRGHEVQEKLYEFGIPEDIIHILFTKRYDLIEYIAKKRRNMNTKKFEQKLEQMPREILAALGRSKKRDIKGVFYRFIEKKFYEIWEGK